GAPTDLSRPKETGNELLTQDTRVGIREGLHMVSTLLCLCLGASSPEDEELARFPSSYVAARQLERYRSHRGWLMDQRTLYGWSGGRYEQWLAATDLGITYRHAPR